MENLYLLEDSVNLKCCFVRSVAGYALRHYAVITAHIVLRLSALLALAAASMGSLGLE